MVVRSNPGPTHGEQEYKRAAARVEAEAAAGASVGLGGVLVADLDPAPTIGARSFVTDATATLALGIGTVVAGGGAVPVPVVFDGTDWLIG